MANQHRPLVYRICPSCREVRALNEDEGVQCPAGCGVALISTPDVVAAKPEEPPTCTLCFTPHLFFIAAQCGHRLCIHCFQRWAAAQVTCGAVLIAERQYHDRPHAAALVPQCPMCAQLGVTCPSYCWDTVYEGLKTLALQQRLPEDEGVRCPSGCGVALISKPDVVAAKPEEPTTCTLCFTPHPAHAAALVPQCPMCEQLGVMSPSYCWDTMRLLPQDVYEGLKTLALQQRLADPDF